MRNPWPFVLLFFLWAVPLFGQDQQAKETVRTSGNAFVRICSVIENDKNLSEREFGQLMNCLGYVSGFADGVEHEAMYTNSRAKRATQGASVPFCIPDEVENGQLIRIVLKYIRDNPAQEHKPTPLLIVAALELSFPCPSK